MSDNRRIMSTPRAKYLKAAGWFVGILIVIVGLTAGGRLIAGRLFAREMWIEPLSDVRLEPSRPHLADRDVTPDNAYYYIRQLTNFVAEAFPPEIRDEIERFQQNPGDATEYPLLYDWEANHAELLALLMQIRATPHSQVVSPDSFDFFVPYVSHILNTSRLLAGLIERDTHNGDWDSAWDRFVLGVEVCDRIMPGGGLINHLLAHAGRARLLLSLRRAAWRHPPPPEEADQMIEYLLQGAARGEPFVEALRYEYLYAMLAADLVYRDPLQIPIESNGMAGESLLMAGARRVLARDGLSLLGSSPAKTRHHIKAVYSQLIAAAEQGCLDDFEAMFEQTYLDRSALGLGFYLSDPIGRILISLLIPPVRSAHHRVLYGQMDAEATAVVLALTRYREDHDHLPERIALLVPEYLPRLPLDRYRPDQPLVYRPEEDSFRLYSVGPNGIDHRGEHHYFGSGREMRAVSDLLFHFTD